jgi:hypothetical protein
MQKKRWGWSLTVLAGIVSACGSRVNEPRASTQSSPEAVPEAPVVAPAGETAGEAPGVEPRQNELQPVGWPLPASGEFVAAPLLDPDVARYAHWRQQGQMTIGKGSLYFLEPLNDGKWLIVKSADEPNVRIFDVATRKQLFMWGTDEVGVDEPHVVLPWTGAGAPGVVVVKADGIWLHAADTGEVSRKLSDVVADDASWSKDGRILITVSSKIPEQTSKMHLFERRDDGSLVLLHELPQSQRADNWDLSCDNRFLARQLYPSNRVTVTDLKTGATTLDAPSLGVGGVTFSPDGRWLALGGEGVKVIDLSNPTRRTEYTYFHNNVSDVQFSPSGDVLVATAYDGKVRLLAIDERTAALSLVQTLSHSGTANVYTSRFLGDGDVLVTSSGDQTVRFWGSGTTPARNGAQGRRWKSPLEWLEWGAAEGAPSTSATVQRTGERQVPPRLQQPPLPARIKPGQYACKVTDIYKLRDCTVEVDERGHTLLEIHSGNLLAVRGVLYDDGPVVRFEGWLTEPYYTGCAECLHQPIHGVLRGQGRQWEGIVFHKGHFDPLVPNELPPANVKIEEAIDRSPLKLIAK